MGYRLNRLDEPIFMAGPKPMLLTEFAIHQKIGELCSITRQNIYRRRNQETTNFLVRKNVPKAFPVPLSRLAKALQSFSCIGYRFNQQIDFRSF